jgi:hypothetical protein
MNLNKFRASYSVLSAWNAGSYERAVGMYFKMADFTTDAMEEGRDFHEKWEREIITTKCLPSCFGSKKLLDPKTELKLVVQLAEWLELVGKIDCIDSPTIHEFKTGKTTSEVYANGLQLPIYGVLASLGGLDASKGEIHHLDQSRGIVDVSTVWLTKRVKEDAFNWVVTNASEMQNYLLENNLYEKFGSLK